MVTKSDFTKMKLSKEALDALILKRVGKPNPSNQTTSTYTLKNGKQVIYVPSSIGLIEHMKEYEYLLAQTFPLHDKSLHPYSITELAFIVTSDGKKTPWTRNPKDVQEFYKIGSAINLINAFKDDTGKLVFYCPKLIEPITHTSRPATDSHDNR